MLDTRVAGHGHGFLCEQRLGWLDARLAEARRHNQPLCACITRRIGLLAFDQIALGNCTQFEVIIARHPQIERIVTGHIHMAVTLRFAYTTAMTRPSVAHTFLPNVDQSNRLVVLMESPACLVHVWSDTALFTYTSHIGDNGPVVGLHDGTQWLP